MDIGSGDQSEKSDIGVQDKMQSGSLFYNVPLTVALPPLSDTSDTLSDTISRNMNIAELDKCLSKELNISAGSTAIENTNAAEAHNKLNNSTSNKQQETDGGISMTSAEKQEWSVTLYDVDSRGSVGEEDLARLVTMLYKAAGASITKSPQHSSKKIKLRLSVAPDPTKVRLSVAPDPTKVTSLWCEHQEAKPSPKTDQSKTPSNTENLKSSTTLKPGVEAKRYARWEARLRTQRSSKRSRTVQAKQELAHDREKQNVQGGQTITHSGGQTITHSGGQTITHSGGQTITHSGGQTITHSGSNGHRPHTHRKKPKKRHSNPHDHSKPEVPVAENKDRRQYYEHLMGIESEQLKSEQLKSEQLKSEQLKSEQLKSEQLKSEQLKGEQLKSEQLAAQRTAATTRVHPSAPAHFSPRMRQQDNTSAPVAATTNSVYGLSRGHSKTKTTQQPHSAVHKQKQVHFEGQGQSVSTHKKHSTRRTAYVHPSGVDLHMQRPESCHLNNLDQVPGLIDLRDDVIDLRDDGFEQELENILNNIYSDAPVTLETVAPHHLRRAKSRGQDHVRAMQQVAKWIQQQPPMAPSSGSTNNTQAKSGVLQHEHRHSHEHHHHYHLYHYYET